MAAQQGGADSLLRLADVRVHVAGMAAQQGGADDQAGPEAAGNNAPDGQAGAAEAADNDGQDEEMADQAA